MAILFVYTFTWEAYRLVQINSYLFKCGEQQRALGRLNPRLPGHRAYALIIGQGAWINGEKCHCHISCLLQAAPLANNWPLKHKVCFRGSCSGTVEVLLVPLYS